MKLIILKVLSNYIIVDISLILLHLFSSFDFSCSLIVETQIWRELILPMRAMVVQPLYSTLSTGLNPQLGMEGNRLGTEHLLKSKPYQ